jgi:hypothetical protein
MRRRVGYYHPKAGNEVEFSILKDDLSFEQQEEFDRVTHILLELQPIQIAYEIYENNFQDLEAASVSMEMNRPAVQIGSAMYEGALEGLYVSTQRVTNLLASFNSFLTLTQDILGRIDRASSLRFEVARNELHSESFAYQFLYQLRNFSQHSGLPIGSVRFQLKRGQPTEAFQQRGSVLILRDKLLNTSFDWKSAGKTLKDQEPEFDLWPLLASQRSIAGNLFATAMDLQAIRLGECSRYLIALLRLIQLPAGAVPVVFVGESADPMLPPGSIELIPMLQLQALASAHRKAIARASTTDSTLPRGEG